MNLRQLSCEQAAGGILRLLLDAQAAEMFSKLQVQKLLKIIIIIFQMSEEIINLKLSRNKLLKLTS